MFSLASVDQTTVSAIDCRPNVCRPNDWRPNDWRQMTSCFWNFWVLLRPERELKLSNGSHPDPGDDLSRVYRSRLSSFDLAQPEKSLKMLSKRFARKRFKKFWAAQRAHRPLQLDPKKVSGFKSWLCFSFLLFVWLPLPTSLNSLQSKKYNEHFVLSTQGNKNVWGAVRSG